MRKAEKSFYKEIQDLHKFLLDLSILCQEEKLLLYHKVIQNYQITVYLLN